MITIYRQSWDANAAQNTQAGALLDAEGALILLAVNGFAARIDEGWCPNPNVGCESDTDKELRALAELPPNFVAPNFDAVTRCELLNAYTALHDTVRNMRCNGGLSGILLKLAHYADQKREAMRLRLDGQIDNALRVEARCDRIYDTLPAWVQW